MLPDDMQQRHASWILTFSQSLACISGTDSIHKEGGHDGTGSVPALDPVLQYIIQMESKN